MHLLPCPHCQTAIPVSPSQAGNQTSCTSCQSDVDIPKLGELRKLPLVEEPQTAEATEAPESSIARRAGFLVLGLFATASLLVAGFCGIRWLLIEVPNTTEEHITTLRQQYSELSAAELVREYEQMDEYGIELIAPYDYRKEQIKKDSWGRNASMAGTVGGLAILGAIALATTGRRNRV